MADDKKPDFDPDKTVVDVRRPEPPKSDDSDRTVVAPVSRPAPPPAQEDSDRTVMIPGGGARRPAAADEDRTIVGVRPGGADPGDRTMVRGAGAPTPASAGAADFQVICLTGAARGRRFPLAGDEVLMGSSSACQVEVPGAAAVHVKLLRQPDGYELQNLGAAGSVVLSGGRKPSRAKLKSGDLVKIGDSVFRYAQSGEIFSSDFDENEFKGSGLGGLLAPENRLYVILGGLVLVLAIVFLWPSGEATKKVVKKKDTSAEEKLRREEIASLLQAGEVLFNDGKLTAPPDQPDVDNAFSKFNEVLSLDPGNEKAREWLKRIDEERDKQRRAREEAEKRRLAEEQARKDRAREELEQKVAAIVAQGDEYYDKGQVTEPVGTNALAKYREALRVYPESQLAQERVARAANYYVERGDELRDKGDPWAALENYRKASRATQGKEELVEKRVQEMEGQLRSGMAGTNVKLIIYKDEKGQLFVLDDMDKVPAKYKDRAVEVNPQSAKPGGGGLGR